MLKIPGDMGNQDRRYDKYKITSQMLFLKKDL